MPISDNPFISIYYNIPLCIDKEHSEGIYLFFLRYQVRSRDIIFNRAIFSLEIL
jgi:hypothetical protein